MKNLFKLVRTAVLMLICCLIVSVPVFASDYNDFSSVKVNVTLKGKTALVMHSAKGYNATPKALKKKWGTPKVTKVNDRKVSTFKAGKSYVQFIPWSAGSTTDGYSLTICAKDKNLKVNGVYVGMTKKAALKALKKSFGKSYVKLSKGAFDKTYNKNCIQVWYGGFMPMEFVYNSKGKITMIYFWHS